VPTSRRIFLKDSLAGASLALTSGRDMADARSDLEDRGSVSADLDDLVGTLRLGGEFFLNKTVTEEDADETSG
jgi:hypothetical protein